MSPTAIEDPALREARSAELQQQIAARARRMTGAQDPGGLPGALITCEQLVATLPPGAAYLTFAETGGVLHAAVVDGTGAETLRAVAPRAEVEQAVAAARRDLRGVAFAQRTPALRDVLGAALRESSARLGDLLLGPVADRIEACVRLVIAPNATVHAVAWHSLPIVDHRPLTVTPSAARWARHGAEGPLDLGRVSAHVGPGLPESREEVLAVRRVYADGGEVDGDVQQASCHDVAQALAQDDLVHVAAHGHHAGDDPLFSSLRLRDGPLFAHDLVHRVRARHIVLSACDVGQARVRVGGEALGMTAALLTLGARCVVAAVAPIADAASAQASTRYHQHLSAGEDAAAALAAAVRDTPGAEPLVCFGSDLRFRRPAP